MKIASKEYVVKRMSELMLNPKKKYSQNFLTDYDTVKESVDALNINESDAILEIGPGLGSLTQELLDRCSLLYAYEIDVDMYNHLKQVFSRYDKFQLYNQDFLKADLSFLMNKKVKVISNVPYNITTPIIEKILSSSIDIDTFEFMVQKEVYDRIKAKKGSKDYSPLNIMIEYVGKLSLVKKVTKDKFIPSPNVDSVILKIDFINQRDQEKEKILFPLIKACFFQRRKTLLNNLSIYFNDKEKAKLILEKASLSENLRGEQLELKDYLKLSEIVQEYIK